MTGKASPASLPMTLRLGPDSAPPTTARAVLPSTPLILVTGKGGVGRSSAATAIAAELSALGRSVALVHPIDAPHTPPPADTPGDLKIIALDREQTLNHYLGDILPGPFAAALRASRAFKLITAATPGLAELLTVGELRRLSDVYDHVVFDAPATGHLLAMLDSPGRFERAAAAGPVARLASDLGRWSTDPKIVSTIAVTTGDGLAVSELIDLLELLEFRMTEGPAMVIANRLAPASPSASELRKLAEAGTSADDPLVASLEKLAARARSERAQLGRVTKHLGMAPVRALERPGHAVLAIAAALRGDDAHHSGAAHDPHADLDEAPVATDSRVGVNTAVERRRLERRTADRRSGGDRYGDAA